MIYEIKGRKSKSVWTQDKSKRCKTKCQQNSPLSWMTMGSRRSSVDWMAPFWSTERWCPWIYPVHWSFWLDLVSFFTESCFVVFLSFRQYLYYFVQFGIHLTLWLHLKQCQWKVLSFSCLGPIQDQGRWKNSWLPPGFSFTCILRFNTIPRNNNCVSLLTRRWLAS